MLAIQAIQGQGAIYVTVQAVIYQNPTPFSFIAQSDDQTVFDLSDLTPPITPRPGGLFILNINGIAQNPVKTTPDYILEGTVITLHDGVDMGDNVYGTCEAQ